MENILNRYLENLNTLEVFITGIEQTLLDQTKNNVSKQLETIKPFMLAMEATNWGRKGEENYEEKIKEIDEFNVESEIKIESGHEDDFKINFPDRESFTNFKSAIDEIRLSINQLPLLFESSLISLVTYFELLISSLLHEYVKNFPDSLSLNNKELKYAELVNFDSMEDAREYLIEKELQALMYSGLNNWLGFFKNKIKVEISDMSHEIEEVNEILVRRNLFVHNGGYVNSIYLNRVKKDLTEGMEKGKRCIVDAEYMISSMRLLELFGVTLAIKLWSKRKSENESIVGYLHNLSFESMKVKKWELVKVLSEFILSFNYSESDNLVAKMNKWLSIKRLGLFETIKENVEQKDLNAKEKHYRICRLALLDEYEKVFEELKDGLPEKLDKEDIMTWPIFEDFRGSEFYQQLIGILNVELVSMGD